MVDSVLLSKADKLSKPAVPRHSLHRASRSTVSYGRQFNSDASLLNKRPDG